MTAPESPIWFKSSHSGGNGGDCVEVAWFKSSYSSSNGGECVEVAFAGPAVGIRDTKARAAGHLTVSGPAWDALLGHALSRNPRTAPST
ncbi:DUF397 domain-containing protein [Amycolatopsis sp. NPDC004625]|uniref:DUF397 domain-containing protein n=1 Tax=Amycolatopsis sp. NPDC004625 TaxID=3154670 RepID=UPI0033B0388D